MTRLTTEQYELILDSLRHTREAFQRYENYPSDEFRQKRLADVDATVEAIRRIRHEQESDTR